MASNEKRSKGSAGETSATPAAKRPRKAGGMRDAVQIDPGYYVLKQGETEVGMVFVEDIAEGQTREHWCLYTSYQWPSSSNSPETLTFTHDSNGPSLSAFKEGMPETSTYVIADCAVQ